MRLIKKYLGSLTISTIIGIAMGIIFHSTNYFLRRLDGVLVEVSHERYLSGKKKPRLDEAFVTEYAFNIELAILSFITVLILGVFILKYKGAGQKRNVSPNKTTPKDTNQNLREHLPPDSRFMG